MQVTRPRLALRAPLIALAACALLGGALLPTAGLARDRHILWAVQGEHNTVYLLGSIHVLRAQDGGLPQEAQDAYQDAEQLVMELDMDDLMADPMAMAGAAQRLAVLPEGQSLRGVLGQDYAAVQTHAQTLGLDVGLLDRFQPWFVATAMLQAELAKRGFSSELGVEETLTRRAVADHKPIRGLETVEQQLGLLAGLPLPEQKRFLLMTIDEMDDFDQDLAQMLTAWRTGNAAELAKVLSEGFAKFPELYRPLTEDRNRAWVGEIAGLLHGSDDYLVVVGALHLVGRNSVVDLLERRGYRVTQQ
jgi:uncharacterized protein YbaP (TraB family)